jgi:MFS family permease
MNIPARVISFVNAAHFIDHYSMLIFAAAVIVMGPALGMAYSELLPYATPGFVAFGAGSLLTGWLGDRWSRRHMMVIFFVGIGASMIAVGLVHTPLQLGAALLSIGLFASIYHPVGTAMIVSYADRLGREMGLTVNDAMVGKYTSEQWRSRAYAVRYFVGFTAAGASVGLVAWLYEQGGFVTMLHAFAGLCLLVIAAAIILPAEIKVPAAGAN